MCLAVPMAVVEILDNQTAIVELDGVKYQANTSLVGETRPGEYLIVHAGFAIEKLDQEEAAARISLFRTLAEESAEG